MDGMIDRGVIMVKSVYELTSDYKVLVQLGIYAILCGHNFQTRIIKMSFWKITVMYLALFLSFRFLFGT